MLNLTLRRVDFNELRVEDISKRPILESLQKFWSKSENEYIDFLEKNNIDFYKNFSSIAELKEVMKHDITILNTIAEQGLDNAFDFKTINLLKSKNLKEIHDHEFMKLTIDLRHINNPESKELIKDLFLETKSVSLVDFVDVNEDSCSLIYHKKGAFYYNDEPYMCNTRESLTLLENYEVPKDNNFILSRLLLDLANKLEENGVEESFCVQYNNGEENNKNIHEVIYWGHLSAEEKKEIKAEMREQKELNNEAKSQAKQELKAEANNNRNSLKPQEAKEVLEQEKNVRLYNISEFAKEQAENKTQESFSEAKERQETKINEIIAKIIELYKQKEQEKLKAKLEKAEKDSANAYNDLKDYLHNGLSILEALKNIQQKYRNEDTINFASLLFSKDILNLRSKEEKIISLTQEKGELRAECENAYNEIEKREETISKLKSTLQSKINEMQNYEYELEKKFEVKLQEKEAAMLKELESLQKEQEKVNNEYEQEIKELDCANEELSNENKKINEQNLKLNSQNAALQKSLSEIENRYEKDKEQMKQEVEVLNDENKKINEINFKLSSQNTLLESHLKEQKKELESLQKEFKEKLEVAESHIKKLYKLEAQVEIFNDKENMYKEQIKELKSKNTALEGKLSNIVENMMNKQNSQPQAKTEKSKRSRDILGDI